MAIVDRSVGVTVDGLPEFNRTLRPLFEPGRWNEGMRAANVRISEMVIVHAAAKASMLGVPQHVIATLRPRKTVGEAAVLFGFASVPDAFGWEFGAHHDEPRDTARGVMAGWNQFPEWHGNQHVAVDGGPGWFLYPTIREDGDEILAEWAESIGELVDEAFPD